MANSKAGVIKKVIEINEPSVELTLSVKEALVLSTILGNVGGSPSESLREDAENILRALQRQVTPFYEQDESSTLEDLYSGALRFNETPPELAKLVDRVVARETAIVASKL